MILVDGYQDDMLLRTKRTSGGGGCNILWFYLEVRPRLVMSDHECANGWRVSCDVRQSCDGGAAHMQQRMRWSMESVSIYIHLGVLDEICWRPACIWVFNIGLSSVHKCWVSQLGTRHSPKLGYIYVDMLEHSNNKQTWHIFTQELECPV